MTRSNEPSADEKSATTAPTTTAPTTTAPTTTAPTTTKPAYEKQKWHHGAPYTPAPTHDVPALVEPMLATILTWPRGHSSPAEHMFRKWVCDRIKVMPHKYTVEILSEGVLYVAPINGVSTTLFSCHLDTMDAHSDGDLLVTQTKEGEVLLPKKKALSYETNFGLIEMVTGGEVGGCLGADDGVGVWLMLCMMEAGVPGGYIFHTGEERGCIGSRSVLDKHEDMLKKFEVAVAFDRPYTSEVITHQNGAKCASDKFADALCLQLNSYGLQYAKSDKGGLTDTKIYRGVIAECVNVAVGYQSQHTTRENLDYPHAVVLRDALLKIQWDSLPVDRDPKEPDPVPEYKSYGGWMGGKHQREFDGMGGWYGDGGYGGYERAAAAQSSKAKVVSMSKGKPKTKPKSDSTLMGPTLSVFEELIKIPRADVVIWCESFPEHAAEAMTSLLLEIGRLRSDVAILRAQFPAPE